MSQQPEVDPSVTAWKSFGSDPAPSAHPPTPDVDLRAWRWGWSRWIGIHYGPIPVGLLIAIPVLIAMR